MSQKVKISLALALIVACGVYAVLTVRAYRRGIPSEAGRYQQGVRGDGREGREDRTRESGERVSSGTQERRFDMEGGNRWGRGDIEQIRQEMMDHMTKELELTPEQQAGIKEIWSGGIATSRGEFEKRIEKASELLTPEQREKADEIRRERGGDMRRRGMQRLIERRLEKARETLPEDQMKIYEKKLQERIEDWENRRGEGGGRWGGRGGPSGERGEGSERERRPEGGRRQ